MRFGNSLLVFLAVIALIACSSSQTPDEATGSTEQGSTSDTILNTGKPGSLCEPAYAANPSWGPHCESHAGCDQSAGICMQCGQPGQPCCDGPRTCASGTCFATLNPLDPTDNVMCASSSCDSATHLCGQPCGMNEGDDCCPSDEANAWPLCRGQHLTCKYSSDTKNGVPVGGKCIACGAANEPACIGAYSCNDPWSNFNKDTDFCDECGFQSERICANVKGNGCHSDRLKPDKDSGTCIPCGYFGGPACLFGDPCAAPLVVTDPRRTGDLNQMQCGQCGLCGNAACGIGGAVPPTCTNNLKAYDEGPPYGIRCWGSQIGWCGQGPAPEGCASDGRCATSEGSSQAASSTTSTGSTPACQCTPSSGDTAAGIALCGQSLGGPCLPQASTHVTDKSLICAPTLGCVPDMLGDNYTCQPAGPFDKWQCQGLGKLDYCWTSDQAGACEGNPGIKGGSGGSGGSGGTGGNGNTGGGGCVGDGCGNNGGGGDTGSCDFDDGTSSARIVTDDEPIACAVTCCDTSNGQAPEPGCTICANVTFCPSTGSGNGQCAKDLSTKCTFQCAGQMAYKKKIPRGAQNDGFECNYPGQTVRSAETCPPIG